MDESHYFISLLKEMMDYESQSHLDHPSWQSAKNEYYKGYASFMKKVYSLRPGCGFHIWSILELQYAEDHVTLLINPDIDALLTFCMSLHKIGVYTEWRKNETNWIVFVYKI